VYLPPESSDSLDYNETLAHVPISSSQLGEYAYGSSFAEESESAFLNDDVESDSSETASIKSESDSSETELDNDEDMTIFSGIASTISLLSLGLHLFICSYLPYASFYFFAETSVSFPCCTIVRILKTHYIRETCHSSFNILALFLTSFPYKDCKFEQ